MSNKENIKVELKEDISNLKQLLIEKIKYLEQEIKIKEEDIYKLLNNNDLFKY